MENENARDVSEVHCTGFAGPMTGPVRRRDDLSLCRVQHELLLLDTEFKKIHQLNETASFIWDTWEQAPDPVEIAKLIAQKYDVGQDVALNDVSAMVGRLRELNLLVVGAVGSGSR